MKRRVLFSALAVALVAMVGCSKDEPVENFSPENAIQFGTYVGRDASTRASVIDLTGLQSNDSGFGVFAYYTGREDFEGDEVPNFMNNQKVTYSGSAWTYSPLKYWPNNVGEKVTFLAYAPYHDNVKVNTDATTIDYTVDTDVLSQEDLLYLDQSNSGINGTGGTINMTKPGVNDKVRFHFAHALSRIGYTAELLVDVVNDDETGEDDDAEQNPGDLDRNTTITINSVKLIGKFDNEATLDLIGGVWSYGAAATAPVTYELNSTNNLQNNIFTGNSASDDYTDVNQRVINMSNSYIMIIPQEMGTLDANTNELTEGTGIKIEVDYNVVTTDGKLAGGEIDIHNVITSEEFYFDFEQGKAYTFKLHLGMTSVKIEATMTAWDEDTDDTAVNVPINK